MDLKVKLKVFLTFETSGVYYRTYQTFCNASFVFYVFTIEQKSKMSNIVGGIHYLLLDSRSRVETVCQIEKSREKSVQLFFYSSQAESQFYYLMKASERER
jgi:hypothetical protein